MYACMHACCMYTALRTEVARGCLNLAWTQFVILFLPLHSTLLYKSNLYLGRLYWSQVWQFLMATYLHMKWKMPFLFPHIAQSVLRCAKLQRYYYLQTWSILGHVGTLGF
jgi:hypothetical protein